MINNNNLSNFNLFFNFPLFLFPFAIFLLHFPSNFSRAKHNLRPTINQIGFYTTLQS